MYGFTFVKTSLFLNLKKYLLYISQILSLFFLNFLLSYLLGEANKNQTCWLFASLFPSCYSLCYCLASDSLFTEIRLCPFSLHLTISCRSVHCRHFFPPHLTLFDLPAPLCGSPGEVTNGGRKGQIFRHPAVVTYYCHEGYQLIGNPRRQCQADGKWSGSLPLCRRKFFLTIC